MCVGETETHLGCGEHDLDLTSRTCIFSLVQTTCSSQVSPILDEKFAVGGCEEFEKRQMIEGHVGIDDSSVSKNRTRSRSEIPDGNVVE